jgi:inner membrane protein
MPSAISHAAVAVAGGIAFAPRDVPHHFWVLSIVCSIIADADVIGFAFGIPYHHFLGHRGFFHSPFFSLLMSVLVTSFFFRNATLFSARWFFYFFFFFMLLASHGILDAFTNGGLGIALLSPFSNTRYFFPWTPITVSPIGIKAFFSEWGYMVMKSELLWICLPAFLIAVISTIIRAAASRY